MPAMTRQRPPTSASDNGALKVQPDDILAKAVPASSLVSTYIKMLLYGPNGTGKTRLAATFPKPLLHIALERSLTGGALSIRKVQGVHVIRPGALDLDSPIDGAACVREFDQLAARLARDNPFRTVVIDHVTAFQDYVLEEVTGAPTPVQNGFGKVSGDHYTERAEKTKRLLLPFLGLPCHTVFVGKEKDHNAPKDEKVNPRTGKVQPDMRAKWLRGMWQESIFGVELGGATAGWLQDACDYLCRMYHDREMEKVTSTVQGQTHVGYRETGKFVRCLRIGFHPNYVTRFRSDSDDDDLPDAIPKPTFDKILASIEGRYKE